MKNYLLALVLLLCGTVKSVAQVTKEWVLENYTKREVMIPMRDGTKLFTAIYEPKDKTVKHPILVERSPYTCAPYGEEFGRYLWTSEAIYSQHNYIMVFQDVRGKNYSEGDYENIRPYIPNKKGKNQIDEASDTYDTVDWLVKNVKNNNGAVGFWGISYPGFYSTMAGVCGHPAVKAVSPQAPVTDWFLGDDMHHNGAFMLMDSYSFFPWFERHSIMGDYDHSKTSLRPGDPYISYLEAGALSNLTSRLDSCPIWTSTMNHPDYDTWWQARDARQGIKYADVKRLPAVMVVGGEFDAEDMWGAIHTYEAFHDKVAASNSSPSSSEKVHFVYGPWTHGGWSRGYSSSLGDIFFGDSVCSKNYMRDVEYPFFAYYLEGKGERPVAVRAFHTGENTWSNYSEWPLHNVDKTAVYLSDNGALSFSAPTVASAESTYLSDPAHPVAYQGETVEGRTTEYLCADQRYASRRPDVLTFQTAPLKDTLRIGGPIDVELQVALTTTDADFVVKVIDVFPDDFDYTDHEWQTLAKAHGGDTVRWHRPVMPGYQMLVRGDVMRGRYRESFSQPKAFVPGEVTPVNFSLPDAVHTFLPGHRLMIQIQSSWYPLVDMNPQQFVDIYKCKDSDFIKTNITIYREAAHASRILLPVIR